MFGIRMGRLRLLSLSFWFVMCAYMDSKWTVLCLCKWAWVKETHFINNSKCILLCTVTGLGTWPLCLVEPPYFGEAWRSPFWSFFPLSCGAWKKGLKYSFPCYYCKYLQCVCRSYSENSGDVVCSSVILLILHISAKKAFIFYTCLLRDYFYM